MQDYNLQIGPVALGLQDFLTLGSLYHTWEWKLDSFQRDFARRDEKHDIDIHVRAGCPVMDDADDKDKGYRIHDKDKGYRILESTSIAFHEHQVLKTNDGYVYRLYRNAKERAVVTYLIDHEWKDITLIEDQTDTNRQFPFEYLSYLMPHVFLRHYRVLTFHGVLMEYKGAGIIISANSGVGKTTHARLWKKVKNSFIINGDKSACYKKEGVWTGFGMPWCGTSGEYMNREVPIKAIVILERSNENHAQKLPLFDGFRNIMQHALYPRWDEDMSNHAMDLLDDFVSDIPVYRLQCRPDEASVEVLYQAIFSAKE